MSKYKANVEDLQKATKTLNASSAELAFLKSELLDVRKVVSAEWTGLAAEAYKLMISNYVNQLQSIKKTVEELRDYSKEAGETMELIDKILVFFASFFNIS